MISTFQPVRLNRLLLVDDDPYIHTLVAGILDSRTIRVFSAYDGDQAVEIAMRDRPDLILLDYSLPGTTGLEVLDRIRAAGVSPSIPVVFITGNESLKILTACFKAGAADYIRKPFCVQEVRARVSSILDRVSMVGELERLVQQDSLTRLCNRRSICDRIQSTIHRNEGNHSALLFLDFDRFKLVNDSLGHDIGDQLLQRIADRLTNAVRRKDSIGYLSERAAVARLGGDEFVVLLEDLLNPNDALIVADRLLKLLDEPYCLDGHHVCCTASIGVVTNVRNYSTPEDVLRDADTAMYAAKSAGKDRYVLFSPEMHAQAEDRLQIEIDLRKAIANQEFYLVYQPIVSLDTGNTTGFEALIRWNHPLRGSILPNSFLPIAEESGLIVPIGSWVLDQACYEFAYWQRSLGTAAPANIHVNVSRKQLLRDLVDLVTDALKKHNVPPDCLHLEVTENEVMQSPEVAKSTLEQLRVKGVKINMDDFGTGHSSLACLLELPIDVLKIDRSFVSNMERSKDYASLVHAVISLGRNLGCTVVAEGIETGDQLAMLQSMECDYGQGYLFGKPMTSDEVRAYLSRQTKSSIAPLRVCPEEILPDVCEMIDTMQLIES